MIDQKKPSRKVRVKKVKGHGGHHGGSWKVAYADFVTAMMALFMVLWLVSQGDQKLKKAVASYFRTPGVFDTTHGTDLVGSETTNGIMDTQLATNDDQVALNGKADLLRKKFSSVGDRDQVKIDITQDGLQIQILDKADEVSFKLGSAELSPSARTILSEIAKIICDVPNPIAIAGHTDSYTYPGMKYTNWELSADRANAARRELEANCVKPEHIKRIIGYADTRLLAPKDPYAPANRRISILLLWQKSAAENLKP